MGALIVNDTDHAVSVAHQHDRLPPDEGAEIVAWIFNLAFVADINPRVPENPFHLEVEDGRIGVDLPVHATRLNVGRQILHHDGNLLVVRFKLHQ
jgi:hypothetical protein